MLTFFNIKVFEMENFGAQNKWKLLECCLKWQDIISANSRQKLTLKNDVFVYVCFF